ncbi:MAG: hypothetical protein KDH92_01660, partial [Chloroflexi bacterium]|nr:hypothetical protein [Chloroflexota bacterium]
MLLAAGLSQPGSSGAVARGGAGIEADRPAGLAASSTAADCLAGGREACLYLPLALRRGAPVAPEAPFEAETWILQSDASAVRDLAVDPRTGDLWLATPGGLLSWDAESRSYARFTMLDGLPANAIGALQVDDEGRVWAGTAKGLAVLPVDGAWARVETGLADAPIDRIALQGWAGGPAELEVWLAGERGTLRGRRAGEAWRWDAPFPPMRALVADRSGFAWMAGPGSTAGTGLYRVAPAGTELVPVAGFEAARCRFVEQLATDAAGARIWLAEARAEPAPDGGCAARQRPGLGYFEAGAADRFVPVEDLPAELGRITALTVDGPDTVWIGGEGQLLRLRLSPRAGEARWTAYGAASGLSQGPVQALAVQGGRLLIGQAPAPGETLSGEAFRLGRR